MMLPIVAYGHPTLRKKAVDIDHSYPGLDELIESMFLTMKESSGVGLAAPQVNRSIRLFIVDASPYAKDYPEVANFRQIFINAFILEENGKEWSFNEGCLSIPDIHEDVTRKSRIRIRYVDEQFREHDEVFDGVAARIIQHEYDHLEGILFVDRISTLRKTLLRRKLNDISRGAIEVDYKMIFPLLKKSLAVR
ncbi:MAG TPA: peptide deformylase [Bacteroidales bacterium]|nr:peptide deformylase [Bacteroidales bacterium]HNS47493.1 peptide deformylase [Bacteroidales bacterium]